MPHFILHCSQNILQLQPAEVILQAVYDAAESTGLFAENDIKVRISTFEMYQLGEGKNNFLHVFGNIMEGRSTEQKAHLSKTILSRLNELLPGLDILSINIREFELATYCNKTMLDPDNTSNDRFFHSETGC